MITEECRDLILEEVSGQVQNDPVLQDSRPVKATPTLPTPVSSQTPRCSGRSTSAPDRYKYLGEVCKVILETMVEDPTSYQEAVTEVDFTYGREL